VTAIAGGFRHALRGLLDLVRSQRNARFHLLATLVVTAVFAVVGISALEWAVIALCIGAVWASEAVNTALEHLSDRACPDRHPLVGRCKDAAAAAVLLASLGAAVAGTLIFLSHV
jgi:diacylglycerol kinase (ATP)